ncbi:hypothetical protein C882_1289 [Caenispirillum salinarum AK4]|uniref:Uncharacterized protein n=1 Tax=Caenispirillum salinarum AK4 TaxID=1238182 RepID=K9GSJ0_9PROT|nr:hypothetical protein C882_1289 [Caenispirillum salinarum AK4]
MAGDGVHARQASQDYSSLTEKKRRALCPGRTGARQAPILGKPNIGRMNVCATMNFPSIERNPAALLPVTPARPSPTA